MARTPTQRLADALGLLEAAAGTFRFHAEEAHRVPAKRSCLDLAEALRELWSAIDQAGKAIDAAAGSNNNPQDHPDAIRGAVKRLMGQWYWTRPGDDHPRPILAAIVQAQSMGAGKSFADALTAIETHRMNLQAAKSAPAKPVTSWNDFAFSREQVFYGGRDIGIPAGLAVAVCRKLIQAKGTTVVFRKLDEESEPKQASDQLRQAVRRIDVCLKSHRAPYIVQNKRGVGYAISPRHTKSH